MNYINEENFFAWYESVTGRKDYNRSALLDEVFRRYLATGRSFYSVSAEQTVSGQEERYPFTYEDTGCCGASTRFIRF